MKLPIDMKIESEDLKALFLAVRFSLKGQSLKNFCTDCEKSYKEYYKKRDNPKSYSQWINGQTIAMTS